MKSISVELIGPAVEAVRSVTGRSARDVGIAYDRWQRNAGTEPCKYGREKAFAVDCQCTGCFQSLAALYFDQVAAKLQAPLTPST